MTIMADNTVPNTPTEAPPPTDIDQWLPVQLAEIEALHEEVRKRRERRQEAWAQANKRYEQVLDAANGRYLAAIKRAGESDARTGEAARATRLRALEKPNEKLASANYAYEERVERLRLDAARLYGLDYSALMESPSRRIPPALAVGLFTEKDGVPPAPSVE